jgi:hypothetical protein
MSEPTRYMHSGGTISTVTLPEPTIITTGRAAMTPAELYESVKPLWERDGSFQPDGLRIGPSRTWEDGLEIDGLYDGINPDRTLALIEAALKATEKQG